MWKYVSSKKQAEDAHEIGELIFKTFLSEALSVLRSLPFFVQGED